MGLIKTSFLGLFQFTVKEQAPRSFQHSWFWALVKQVVLVKEVVTRGEVEGREVEEELGRGGGEEKGKPTCVQIRSSR